MMNVDLPGTVPDACSGFVQLEEAGASLCKHGRRVWVQFDGRSELFDSLIPFTLMKTNIEYGS